MAKRPGLLRFALDRGLKAELVRSTAFAALVFRLLEGLGAWVLFGDLQPLDGRPAWPVHLLFLVYFLVNGWLSLSYRNRVFSPVVLTADVGVNMATMALLVVATGGLESPVVLILIMKVAGYGLLFSTRVALLGIVVGVAALAGSIALLYPDAGILGALRLGRTTEDFMRLALLAIALAGGMWVFSRVAENERRAARAAADVEAKRRLITREVESARAATERADDAYTETVALDGVSETLSGFTQPRDILNKVVEIARSILWWDYCLILLWDDQTQTYYCSEVSGFEPERARKLRGLRLRPDDEPDLEWVRRLGHCAVIAPRAAGRLASGETLTLLTAPLYSDADFYGVLQFARTGGQQSFTTNDLRLADRLVARTTTALRRARHLKEQQEAERLAAAGELAAGVAHEVNNALAGIQGQVRAVAEVEDPVRLRAALETVDAQTHRIAAIIQEVLGFGRPQQPSREPVDVRELAAATVKLMAHEFERCGVAVELQFPPRLKAARADPKQIQQVLVNLFTNAIHAMQPNGGTLAVSAHEGSNVVYLDIRDSGPGVPEEIIDRIFDPFFSTKRTGTGLGLSVSFNIVRAHGGDLTVDSTPDQGAIFTIRLPTLPTGSTQALRSALLVDDEPAVAASIEDMLTREGLRVERAATGEEALQAMQTANFDVVFLDVKLPDITGPEVYARLLATRPELARRVIFVTGGLWRFDRRGFREKLPPQPLLAKPCTSEQIREALRSLQALAADS
jgi:signal transduction histidine kinase/ActR/RegA family two-component response regulator